MGVETTLGTWENEVAERPSGSSEAVVRGEVIADPGASPAFWMLKAGAMTLLLLSDSWEEVLPLLCRDPSISSTLRATQSRSPKRVLRNPTLSVSRPEEGRLAGLTHEE